jgi:hypothetical protein
MIDVLGQLGPNFVICGDFNAHSTLWGYASKNRIGGVLKNILASQDVVVRNGVGFTYIDARSGATSTIDLTIISPEIASEFL